MEISGSSGSPTPSQYEAVKARVVTRAFGVRLGIFGVDYTSRQVSIDPDAGAGRSQSGGQTGQEQAGTRDAGGFARPDAHDAVWTEAAALTETPRPRAPSDPAWRKCIAAYARAASAANRPRAAIAVA